MITNPVFIPLLQRLTLFALLIIFSALALAEPVITIKSQFYPVNGNSIPAIYNSLQQNGPAGENGGVFHAQTRWKIHWSYRWVGNHKVCQILEEEVHVDISILMPQLNLEGLDPAVASSWSRYYDALLQHEHQHKDYGVAASRELDQALLSFQPKNCSRLEQELDELSNSILTRYEQKERDFDRETDHGKNQGVVLK